MISTEENCPLCQNRAKYIPQNFDRFRMFNCKKCKVFVIGCDLIENLAKLPNKDRETLSMKSNECADEELLVISVEDSTGTFIHYCRPKNNWLLD